MRKFLVCLCLLAFAFPASAQTVDLSDKILQLQNLTAKHGSDMAKFKADVANELASIKADVAAIRAQVFKNPGEIVAAMLPANPNVPGRCTCGCEKTGQCTCPNCSVGCGFLPASTAIAKAPMPSVGYAEAYAQALQLKIPLVVCVGVPPPSPLSYGCVETYITQSGTFSEGTIVVGMPRDDGAIYVSTKLPATATAAQVQIAVNNAKLYPAQATYQQPYQYAPVQYGFQNCSNGNCGIQPMGFGGFMGMAGGCAGGNCGSRRR